MKAHGFATFIALLVVWGVGGLPTTLPAQPVITAENQALGGGGITYLEGPVSNFLNPANLMLRSRESNIHVTLGSMGIHYLPVQEGGGLPTQLKRFRNLYRIHRPGSNPLGVEGRTEFIQRNFGEDETLSEHVSRYDLVLGGISWQRQNRAFSLVARTRMSSRLEIGRGWYDSEFIQQDEKLVRDFTLRQQSQTLHEISFGYAQSFELINGLIPRISEFYVGFAPKLVISSSLLDLNADTRFVKDSALQPAQRIQSLDFYSSGDYSRLIQLYRLGVPPSQAIPQSLDRVSLQSSGGEIGFGFDFGVTYVLNLGSDISLAEAGDRGKPLTKSLRIGFSVTDIGVINFSEQPLTISKQQDTLAVPDPQTAQSIYTGAPGQFLEFLNQTGNQANPFTESLQTRNTSFSTLLPGSFNGGLLFQYNRIRIMSDLTIGLSNTAFNSTRFVGRVGLEGRPLPYLALRAGTRFATNYPPILSAGTGLFIGNWEVNIAARVIIESESLHTTFGGGGFAGVQLHF